MRTTGSYQVAPTQKVPTIAVTQNTYVNEYIESLSHLWDSSDHVCKRNDQHEKTGGEFWWGGGGE